MMVSDLVEVLEVGREKQGPVIHETMSKDGEAMVDSPSSAPVTVFSGETLDIVGGVPTSPVDGSPPITLPLFQITHCSLQEVSLHNQGGLKARNLSSQNGDLNFLDMQARA